MRQELFEKQNKRKHYLLNLAFVSFIICTHFGRGQLRKRQKRDKSCVARPLCFCQWLYRSFQMSRPPLLSKITWPDRLFLRSNITASVWTFRNVLLASASFDAPFLGSWVDECKTFLPVGFSFSFTTQSCFQKSFLNLWTFQRDIMREECSWGEEDGVEVAQYGCLN